MSRSRLRAKGRRDSRRFAGIPHVVMDHQCFVTLSAKAVRLLLEFARQYNGFNNGDLCATWRLMRSRGWVSRDTLGQALAELLEHDLIMLTRQGGKNKTSLYALTWASIDECRRKLDVASTRTPPSYWQQWSDNVSMPDPRVNETRQPGQSHLERKASKPICPDSRVSQGGLCHAIDPPAVSLNRLPGAPAQAGACDL